MKKTGEAPGPGSGARAIAEDNFLCAVGANRDAGVPPTTSCAVALRTAACLACDLGVTEEQWLCFARKMWEQAKRAVAEVAAEDAGLREWRAPDLGGQQP